MSIGTLSAFFPCYNDEHTIAGMVHDVHRAVADTSDTIAIIDRLQIVVVDDGSRDGSVAVLRALQSEVGELELVEHGSNRGYGGALISGFAAATGDWVFYTDGDGQYDASEITRCLVLVGDDIDVVQGFKIGRGDPWYRKVIGRVYHHVVKLMFGLHVRDTDCDFRLIRRSALEGIELTSTSGVICVELMHKLERSGARFVEVGVSHYERPHGRSQFFRVPAIARSARQLVELWWDLVVSDRRATGRTGRRAHAPGSGRGSRT